LIADAKPNTRSFSKNTRITLDKSPRKYHVSSQKKNIIKTSFNEIKVPEPQNKLSLKN
jgi:hypothetical protein